MGSPVGGQGDVFPAGVNVERDRPIAPGWVASTETRLKQPTEMDVVANGLLLEVRCDVKLPSCDTCEACLSLRVLVLLFQTTQSSSGRV
jgi:hypothetical protein